MDQLELADRFDRERRRLRSVAYRILGSLTRPMTRFRRHG